MGLKGLGYGKNGGRNLYARSWKYEVSEKNIN